jgi:hypothetical protein
VFTLPPFIAQWCDSVVGAFTMFRRIERYHIDLEVTDAARVKRLVSLPSIAPHLTPEAQRILLPAEGRGAGADQIDVAIAALPDLAALLCKLETRAISAEARLSSDPFDPQRTREARAEQRCSR